MSNARVIKKENFLMGIRHWVQYYPNSGRREIFQYVGRDNCGLFYFKSLKEHCVISKTQYQLHTEHFKPFIVDNERILDAMEAEATKRQGGAT